MKKRRWTHDLILACGILLAAGILYLGVRQFAQPGTWAVIEQDGVEIARLPLDQEGDYLVEAESGSNLVCTRAGGVWIQEADCPDQLCVRQGVISDEGGRIVCLPHRLVVRVEGASGPVDGMVR